MDMIAAAVETELNIPVLSFDVPYSPGRLNEQVVTRMQGFMELLRQRKILQVRSSAAC
jgi:benzoyl-CoA reductase/2-hydroxyglutaryl-CoA dehydratase subunit BcrC/BadD/HgdB